MAPNRQVLHADIPFRIRIGVTGECVLSNTAELSATISQVLDTQIFDLFDEASPQLLHASSHTKATFSVLTSLAEGAGRLVAQEVLKRAGSKIEVVLPFPQEGYLQEFPPTESRHEFEKLLSKARRPIILDGKALPQGLARDELEEVRRQAYERASRFIVDHCDVLIVLRDGQPSASTGGTAEMIAYAKTRSRPVLTISTVAPYDITVEKNEGSLNVQSLDTIEMFNSFPISQKEQQEYIGHISCDLFDTPEGYQLPAEAKTHIREKLLPFYVRASQIAKYNQRLYRSAGLLVHSFAPAAIAAVALGILIPGWSLYAFQVEGFLLVAILLIVLFADRRKTHKKWIESRFLAERLRSAIFLAACGVEASPIQVPPYMGLAHRPDDWMVRVFNEIWDRLPLMPGCQGQSCKVLVDFVRQSWLQDQIRFHVNKAKDAGRLGHRLEWGGMIIFAIALIAAVSHVILSFTSHEAHGMWLEKMLTFVAIVLPAIGAATEGIRTHREYSRLAKRSENMASALRELDERSLFVSEPEALESLLRETEELMLRETQDWLMLMRFTDVRPVI